jgi:hypothetical protein
VFPASQTSLAIVHTENLVASSRSPVWFESLSATDTKSKSMAEFEGKSLPVEESEEKEEEEDTTLANPDVTTKYQESAKIANSTLSEIVSLVG